MVDLAPTNRQLNSHSKCYKAWCMHVMFHFMCHLHSGDDDLKNQHQHQHTQCRWSREHKERNAWNRKEDTILLSLNEYEFWFEAKLSFLLLLLLLLYYMFILSFDDEMIIKIADYRISLLTEAQSRERTNKWRIEQFI